MNRLRLGFLLLIPLLLIAIETIVSENVPLSLDNINLDLHDTTNEKENRRDEENSNQLSSRQVTKRGVWFQQPVGFADANIFSMQKQMLQMQQLQQMQHLQQQQAAFSAASLMNNNLINSLPTRLPAAQMNPQMGSFMPQGLGGLGQKPRYGGGKNRKFNLQKVKESKKEEVKNEIAEEDYHYTEEYYDGDYAETETSTKENNSPVLSHKTSSKHSCGVPPQPIITRFVANGMRTNPHEHPWYAQVTIGSSNSSTFCGGTLISPNHIITAAHCYDEISSRMRASSTLITMKGVLIDESKYFPNSNRRKSNSRRVPLQFRATEVYLHPHYVPAMSELEARLLNKTPGPRHDLAIIEFEFEDKEISEVLTPVCLPNEFISVEPGTKCVVMGHGFTNPSDEDTFTMPMDLQSAVVTISTNEACQEEVDSISIKSKINSDTLCIRGRMHPCVGDSGGPLICAFDDPEPFALRRYKKRSADQQETINLFRNIPFERIDEDEENPNHEHIVNTNFHVNTGGLTERFYLAGVTSFAVSTDQHDRCGQFRSAVFGKVFNYLPWIRSIIGF